MQSHLTLLNITSLFGAMLLLAAVPGVSVLAVTARSAASGFMHGLFVTVGIVAGDMIFILVAILGLSFLAEAMGGLFVWVQFLGGGYLIWLGIALCRSKSGVSNVDGAAESTFLSSFMAGLLMTLGDQKAILFYLGFLPGFVDLSTLSVLDAGIVMALATAALGSVKLVYAYLAANAGLLIGPRTRKGMNVVAGGVMISVGLITWARAA